MHPVGPLLLALLATAVTAQTLPDPDAVRAAQADLGAYHDVQSDISCEAPTIPAHQMMCEDEELWQMGLLDSWAWLFAVESATGTEMDHGDPPLDETFIELRDACPDRACLIGLLVRHTNASLGGMSPYGG
jgi:hypothetical protein